MRNANTGTIIATRVDHAVTFFERFIGLLGRPRVRADEGLWIERCSAIHTIGMRATIDVVFVDSNSCVVATHSNVRTFSLALTCARAKHTIELGGGALKSCDLLPGDRLELVHEVSRGPVSERYKTASAEPTAVQSR